MNNCENCIDNRPRIGRLAGVTRTLRLAIYEGEGVPTGTPQDLTGNDVVVRVLRDGTEDIYLPGFVVEGDDHNVIKFEWPAAEQAVGNYTIDVTVTDGSGNVNRVNWHGPTGIRLVEFSYQEYGEDAVGQASSEGIGLVGYYTTNGVGMSAYDEWLAQGHTGTEADYIAWMQQPAREAASVAEAAMTVIQARADEDHATAGSDHTTATGDHAVHIEDHRIAGLNHLKAEDDHTRANTDHSRAESDHSRAEDDHSTAGADHTQAGSDHTRANNDHSRAESDHVSVVADHLQAAADHTKATQDSTRAGSDHDIAVADHAQAEADHTRAESDHTTAAADHTTAASDHTTAAADHTQAVADHAVMAGYDTRLTNIETDVTQLGQYVAKTKSVYILEGKGSTYINLQIPLIKGRKYQLVLDNPAWSRNDTGTGTEQAIFVILSYNGTTATRFYYTARWEDTGTFEKEYVFTVPSDSIYIEVGGRANIGTSIIFSLKDVTAGFIDTSNLSNPAAGSLAAAEDVMQLRTQLIGTTAKDTKVVLEQNTNWYDGKYLHIAGAQVSFATYPGATPNGVLIVNVEGYKRVRFLGIAKTLGLPKSGYGFSASQPDPTNTSTNQFELGYSIFDGDVDPSINAFVEREYLLDIPDGAKWAAVTIAKDVNTYHTQTSLADFYCYLEVGENVKDQIVESIEGFMHGYEVPIKFARSGYITYVEPPMFENSDYYGISGPIHIKKGYTVHVISRGAGIAYIVTCDANGGNIVPQAWKDSQQPITTEHFTYAATEDCYVMVCARNAVENSEPSKLYYTVPSRLDELIGLYLDNNSMNKTKKTFIAELTMASLDADGTVIQYNNDATTASKKTVASVYYIEIGGFDAGDTIKCEPLAPINTGETYKVFFFDKDYAAISNSTLSSLSDYEATIPANAKYLRLAVTSASDLAYSVRYVEVSAKTTILRWSGVRDYSTASDYITQSGTLKYYRTIFEVPYNGERLVNLGWFFYSTDYTPLNKKSKLVLLYTGSDAYKWGQGWNAFSDNYHSIVFSLVHSGYCVALCSCLTSLYGPTSSSVGISDCSGDQLSINAYDAYYQYIVANFNVENEPYILGYSNGGMPSGRYNILGNIPAKAIAGGAIVTDLVGLIRILGYVDNINKILHNCGVPDDVVVEHNGWSFTDSDFAVLKSQGDILKNYSPLFMSCDGLSWSEYIDTMKGVNFVNMENDQSMITLMSKVRIQSKVPIKMWHARDDINVSYGLEKFYIEALNRGGGRAFLRTMPNNAGKHAMGNYGDENSIKVQDYHFKDGTVANTTLFMAEVLDWFSSWQDGEPQYD